MKSEYRIIYVQKYGEVLVTEEPEDLQLLNESGEVVMEFKAGLYLQWSFEGYLEIPGKFFKDFKTTDEFREFITKSINEYRNRKENESHLCN